MEIGRNTCYTWRQEGDNLKGFGIIIKVVIVFGVVLVLVFTLMDIGKIQFPSIWGEPSRNLAEGWRLTVDGSEARSLTLPVDLGEKGLAGEWTAISQTIPNDLSSTESLMMRTSQKLVRIYVDNQMVYNYDAALNKRDIKIIGLITHFAWLPDDCAGKTLTIRTYACEDAGANTFYEVYIGTRISQVISLIRYDGLSTLIGMLLLIISVVFFCLTFIVFRQIDIYRSTLFFSGVEFCAGLWVFCGTQATQLLIHNQLYLLTGGVVALFFLPFFLTLFVTSTYNIPGSRIMDRIALVFPVVFIVVTTAQRLGFITYFQVLTPVAICLFLDVGVLVGLSVSAYQKGNKNVKFFLVAVSSLLFSILGELILLLLPFETFLNALFLNLGIMAFGLILLYQLLSQFMRFVERKGKEEYLISLARIDALTGIGNRRAYDEMIDQIRLRGKNSLPVALFLFDVNNLKKKNDQFGHAAGDELLKDVAKDLVTCFLNRGDSFRIGGDEFSVVVTPCDAIAYKSMVQRVEKNFYSDSSRKSYSLAFGSTLFTPTGSGTIDMAFKYVDDLMYRRKKLQKQMDAKKSAYRKNRY